MKAVYLAGPMFGCSDDECSSWRERARRLLSRVFDICDPVDRDFRGAEAANAPRIVELDLLAIAACDIVLVNAARPSWGTAMEVFHAKRSGKTVVAFGVLGEASPWLSMHSDAVVASLDDAVSLLLGLEPKEEVAQ